MKKLETNPIGIAKKKKKIRLKIDALCIVGARGVGALGVAATVTTPGHTSSNKSLLLHALTHHSYKKNHKTDHKQLQRIENVIETKDVRLLKVTPPQLPEEPKGLRLEDTAEKLRSTVPKEALDINTGKNEESVET